MRSRPARIKTRKAWNEPGHAHALTFCCFHRYPFLSAERTRQWFIEALDRTRRGLDVAPWLYVITPEHAHVLLFPRRPATEISAVLKSIKQSVARRAVSYLRTRAPAWLERIRVTWPTGRIKYRFWQQGGGYDRNIFREDAAWSAIEYIHLNPVRRGLCTTPTDWGWSSARWYAGMRPVRLEMDEPPPGPSPRQWTRRRAGGW